MAAFIAMTSWRGEFTEDYLAQPAPDPAQFGMPSEDDGSRDDPLLSDRSSAVSGYRPDVDRLAAAPTRVVIAVGEESLGTFTGRAAVATAELLGQEATVFPSHHGGFIGGESGYAGQPEAFAAKLRDVLDGFPTATFPTATFPTATFSTTTTDNAACDTVDVLWSMAFNQLGVVVSDIYFVDPRPRAGQDGAERGVRLELRVFERDDLVGSIYSSVPIRVGRPLWRVDLLESVASAPGSLDRAHHHPRLRDWEPGRRVFDEELSKDPVGWLGPLRGDRGGARAGRRHIARRQRGRRRPEGRRPDGGRGRGAAPAGRRGGSGRAGPGRCRRVGPLQLALTTDIITSR